MSDNELTVSDWIEMFSVDRATYTARPPLQKQRIESLTSDQVESLMASYATKNSAGTELGACGILILKHEERAYASFRAWNDYTGWGCRDGVDFHVGTFHDVLRWGLGDHERQLLGYEEFVEREGWGAERLTENFSSYEEE